MKITLNEIIEIGQKYVHLCEEGYFNRKYSISRIYDHFFAKLFFRLRKIKNNESFELIFSRNINHCSNDYFESMEIGKPSLNLGTRTISIPNLYDTIMYEVMIHRVFHEIIGIINTNPNLQQYLLNEKYFSYAHRVDLKSKIIFYEHYLNGWLEYEKYKKLHLKEKTYSISTDIKGFYDNIDHDNFISLLGRFFKEYNKEGTRTSIQSEMLFSLNSIFYKVSGFKKKGLPQGLVGSDMLAQVYLWLIFYFQDGIIFDENNFILKGTSSKFIIFADDIIVFSQSEKNVYKGFTFLKNVLERYGLELNSGKTSEIKLNKKNTSGFKKINISKIQKNDEEEVERMLERILMILSSEELKKHESELKTLFKWFGKIYLLNTSKKREFIKRLIRKGVKFNSKKLENNKKLSLLLIISPGNFKQLLIEVNMYYIEVYPKVHFEKFFISTYLSEAELYLPLSNLVFLFLELDNELLLIKEALDKKISDSKNLLLIDLINGEGKYLRSNLLKNKLYGLFGLLYTKKFINENCNENIIGIKINSLFDIDIKIISSFSDKVEFLTVEKHIIPLPVLNKLSNILDSLLMTKMTHKLFYLVNPSFIADLYSLFNLLITILHCVENKKAQQVKVGKDLGSINCSEKNSPITQGIRLSSLIENHKYLLYYVTKNRAMHNHKEIDVKIGENPTVKSFDEGDNLSQNIKIFIYDTFKEISEELEIQY